MSNNKYTKKNNFNNIHMQIINARFLSGVSLLFGSIALWFYNDEQNGWVWYTFATLAVLTAALAAWSAYFENRVSERSSSGSVSSPHKPADETTENTKKQTDRRQTIWKRMTDKNVIESFSGYGSIPRTKKTKKKTMESLIGGARVLEKLMFLLIL